MIKQEDGASLDKEAWVGKSCGALAFALTFLLLFLSRKKVKKEKYKHRFKKSGEVKINDNALVALALLVAQGNPDVSCSPI